MGLVANRVERHGNESKDTRCSKYDDNVQFLFLFLFQFLFYFYFYLSRSLQDSSTSAAQGNRFAQDVVKTLLKDRTNVSFSLFLGSDLTGQNYRVSQSQSGTKLENRTPTKDHYRRIYFNAKDTVM